MLMMFMAWSVLVVLPLVFVIVMQRLELDRLKRGEFKPGDIERRTIGGYKPLDDDGNRL